MAASDKNIVISPQRGSATLSPTITFTGDGNDPITLYTPDGAVGSLSFEGSAGQLFSVTNNLTSGSIFSVNDVSGIPSLDIDASGLVQIAPLGGEVALGQTTVTAGNVLDVKGNVRIDGDLSITGTTLITNLNADLLDGIDSGSFLRSDANDTLSAIITGHASDTEVLRVTSSTHSDRFIYIGGWSGTNSNNIARIRTSANLHIDSPADGDLYLNWYASNKTIHLGGTGQTVRAAGNNTVWHAGNDGSGSGLDADLLDGVDSSQIPYGSNSTATTSSDPTAALKSGFYDIYQTNAPTSTWYSYINMRHTNAGNNHGHQIAGSFYSTGDIYNRNIDNGTFGSWTKIWNASNDGSGSGLDADLLDGINSGSFLRSDAVDTATSNTTWSFNATNQITLNKPATTNYCGLTFSEVNDARYLLYMNNSTDANLILQSRKNGANIKTVFSVSNSTGVLNFGQTPTSANNIIWHGGNDGSGSGLDADTVDGIQGSSFLRSDANDTATGTLTVRDIKLSAGYHLQRSDHHSGHLEGSYNNVGQNSAKTNPIYTIGSSYNPNDASLGDMYGIGYTNGNNSYAWNAISSGAIMGGAYGWGLYVAADGDVRIFLDGSTGAITMTSYVYEGASDGRLKTNVKPIENALEKVLSIRGVEYDWVDNITSEYEFHPTLMHDVGVIAQEVQAVQPELVNIAPFNGIYTRKTGWKKIQERLQAEENERASAEGDEPRTIKKAEAKTEFGNLSNEERDELCEDQQFLTVDYKRLSVLLIEAIKEQQATIENLTSRVEALENS